jgi:hypothetical protein
MTKDVYYNHHSFPIMKLSSKISRVLLWELTTDSRLGGADLIFEKSKEGKAKENGAP